MAGLKVSGCIGNESLCIMAGLKVSGSSQCHVYCWTLRDDSSGRMMANLEMTDITVRWSGLDNAACFGSGVDNKGRYSRVEP